MPDSERRKAKSPQSLSGLMPFLRPYRLQIGLALVFLLLAAGSTLALRRSLSGIGGCEE